VPANLAQKAILSRVLRVLGAEHPLNHRQHRRELTARFDRITV
jgi:hypothetical protein